MLALRLTVFFTIFSASLSSVGDRSYIFSKCLTNCARKICSHPQRFVQKQPFHLNVLQWSCDDECKYKCMWKTVQAFEDDGTSTPQFYGKWPFVRFLGIQEPASMIFSVMNALTHLSILSFRSKVDSSTPLYGIWHGMAIVGVITWSCAAIFHTRDFPLTERLDYFSAFGLVLYNLFTLIARLTVSRDRRLLSIPAVVLASFWLYHISSLYHRFDYGYNMLVNVAVGTLNALGWVVWCWYQYVKGHFYVWRGALVVLGLSLLLALELFDFPPLFWTLDAHAMWHAGTVSLTLLWYRFIIADSLRLEGKDEEFWKKAV